jgi:hypothetical protein
MQAHERVVAGRSDEHDLRLTYELKKADIDRQLAAARQSQQANPTKTADTYVPDNPFEAFSILLDHHETRPDEPQPRGTLSYVRRDLETKSMRRTPRNERQWRKWFDTQMLLLHADTDHKQ